MFQAPIPDSFKRARQNEEHLGMIVVLNPLKTETEDRSIGQPTDYNRSHPDFDAETTFM